MTDKEHKDLYIAAAVGGLGLVLVLLYLFGGHTASGALNAAGQPLQTVAETATPPALSSDYNYNIAPYNPNPLITQAAPNLGFGLGGGGGCCDDCGPSTGSTFNHVNVAQFSTLLGTGAG